MLVNIKINCIEYVVMIMVFGNYVRLLLVLNYLLIEELNGVFYKFIFLN